MSLHESIKSEDNQSLLSSHITHTNSSPPSYDQHLLDTPCVSLDSTARKPVTSFTGTNPNSLLTFHQDGQCDITPNTVNYGSEDEDDDEEEEEEEEEEGEMTIIDISGGNDHIPEGLLDDHTFGLLAAIALGLRSQKISSYRGVNLASTLGSNGVSKSRSRAHSSYKSSGNSYESTSSRAHTDLDTIEEVDCSGMTEVERDPFDLMQADHQGRTDPTSG
ncbi:hypothetical protein I203_107179 [Kwoniella mangroviensis CBS 8507]|uniref:hypothetical protein n=1 Tax=Kwoniella mangroviensis CBS 8507 TaxID=1296122 RepID=UPI00080D60A0|nr:uncharacterized protein I203_01926 [Kwoniella mangroviensis CBS 8507]OCF68543.1 hypothetical protein I203_01926 [Kwoniella mangroviensis CBS 8507]